VDFYEESLFFAFCFFLHPHFWLGSALAKNAIGFANHRNQKRKKQISKKRKEFFKKPLDFSSFQLFDVVKNISRDRDKKKK
jgi:hypothetical protein